MDPSVTRTYGRRPGAGLHWAKRPLPEPPRTRRVSKWSHLPEGGIQDTIDEWLREHSVSYTHDGD